LGVSRGLTDMTTMPLYWVEYSYLKHPNSYARIVVKTTLLVSFLTVPQNEKQRKNRSEEVLYF